MIFNLLLLSFVISTLGCRIQKIGLRQAIHLNTDDKNYEVKGPFTKDFVTWLDSKSELSSKMFINESLENSQYNTFGGKESTDEEITKIPIIFFHGNGDGALKIGNDEFNSGWTEVMSTLMNYGYDKSSMYAYTYGERDMKYASNREMRCNLILQANKFITAVLEYTGVETVDIIGHSMGASIARKSIIGGKIRKEDDCSEIPSLQNKVRNFISISAAHYGFCTCSKEVSKIAKACGTDFGFYSGSRCSMASDKETSCNSFEYVEGECKTEDYSTFLKDINDKKIKEGRYILSIWSDDDEVLGYKNNVWGRKTSLHPMSDERVIFVNKTHQQTKNDAGMHIYKFISKSLLP